MKRNTGIFPVKSIGNVERVEFIFKSVLAEKVSLYFICVDSEGVAPEILEKLIAHEKGALEGLRKNGLIF